MKTTALHLLNYFLKFLKYALILLAALFFISLIILGTSYRSFKNIVNESLSGKKELTASVETLKRKNWPLALSQAESAQSKFNAALNDLETVRKNKIITNLPIFATQINDLEYLLKTAEILNRSLLRVLPLAQQLDEISSRSLNGDFSTLKTEDKENFLKLIYEAEPELNGLKANLNLAVLNLEKIHRLGLLWPLYRQISDLKNELQQATILMSRVTPLAKLLPILAGYPEASRFLLILQNNDELRPSGGFIGVYGILESKSGELSALITDDSYHVDMPAVGLWKLEPPAPIKKYLKVENWYFRDANWSPDWPTSAQKIEEIYQGEMNAAKRETRPFTGVAAINPDLVADLLRLVGPITVRDETYTADNFQPLLQYNVEVAYKEQNISSWDRKEIINELLNELKKRLFSLSANKWPELLKIIDRNIVTKNIQIYLNNNRSEELINRLGIGGEVKQASSDYLLVTDANLAAFKSDAVVKKQISYQVATEETNLKARLQLDYRHEGGFDWRTTRYRSYTKVYTPFGSQFLSLEGLDETTSDLSVINDEKLNKTIFGFFISVEPGSSQQIILKYNLPTELDRKTYSLLVQKQSGRRTDALNLNLNIEGKIFKTKTDLNTDKYFPL